MPPVSEVVTTYVQLDATFADGAMRMLRSPFAQTTIALLRELFGDGSTHRESEVLYAQMDAMLDELEFADCKVWRHTDGSRMDAREVVHETWVREFKLLERRILPTGESEHALRPEALAVLACADAIGNETITLSSPRVEMIVEALTRLSMVVNPDPAAQRADLVARVKEAQRALDEFDRKGGKLPPDLDPEETAEEVVRRYQALWDELTREETFGNDERFRLDERLHRLLRPRRA
jgi:hypothetical protein